MIDPALLVNRLSRYLEAHPVSPPFTGLPVGRWASRATTSLNLGRLGKIVVDTLDTRFSEFSRAMDDVRWPATTGRDARLPVLDPDIRDRIQAGVRQGEDASRYYKFFSDSVDENAATTLDAGDHDFRLGLGPESETVTVNVAFGDTNREVLDKVALAVNQADLPVQAEVVTQYSPEFKVNGLQRTGTMLGFAVNQAHQTQDLDLDDTDGDIIASLDLEATDLPVGAPRTRAYQLRDASSFSPSTFVSKSFDPGEETFLPAGDHAVDWTMGDDSGTIEFTTYAGDTWKDVLTTIARAAGNSQDKFSASLETADVPYYDPRMPDVHTREAMRLTFQAADPKLGERLSFTANAADSSTHDYSGAEDHYGDPDYGLPSALGVEATPHPGRDATLTVNGETLVRAPGTFARDQGRLLLDVEESFAGPASAKVSQAVPVMLGAVQDLADAYNSLRSFLDLDPTMWTPGFAKAFSKPVRDNAAALSRAGFRQDGQGGMSVDEEAFGQAVATDPARVRRTLLGEPDGLIPSWQRLVERARDWGLDEFLRDPEALRVADAVVRRSLSNELRASFLDLLG